MKPTSYIVSFNDFESKSYILYINNRKPHWKYCSEPKLSFFFKILASPSSTPCCILKPLACRPLMISIFYIDSFSTVQVRYSYSYSFKLWFRNCLGWNLWGFQLTLLLWYVLWLSFIFQSPNSNSLQLIFVFKSNRLESLHNILFSVPIWIKIFITVDYAPCQAPINNHRSFALSIAFHFLYVIHLLCFCNF
jgi:hypothetical protein